MDLNCATALIGTGHTACCCKSNSDNDGIKGPCLTGGP